MSTQRDASKENEPQPREPFGQPTTGEAGGQAGDQKPGYDPSPPPAGLEREEAALPPYKPGADQTPLAERIRQQPAGQEEESK